MLLSTHGLQPASATFLDETSFYTDGTDEKFANLTAFNSLPADNGLSPYQKFSISLWFRADTITTSDVIYKITDSSGVLVQYLVIKSTGQLQAFMQGSGSNWSRTAVGAVTTGTWYHLCMVYDGTLNRYSRQKVYVNASLSGHTSNFFRANHAGSNDITVMAGVSSAYANGDFNEFAVWNDVALSSSEVTALYNGGSATDLNLATTVPHHWYRSENASWDGSIWRMADLQGNGPNLQSENMQLTSRTNDVP